MKALASVRGDGVRYYYARCAGCGTIIPVHEDTLRTGMDCRCGRGQYNSPLEQTEYDMHTLAKAPDMGMSMATLDDAGWLLRQ